MALPWLIGAAVVGGLAYLGSDSSDDDDDYEREERAKRRARQRAIDEANSKIEKEIQRYKNRREDYFQDRYDIDISFSKEKISNIFENKNFAQEIEALSIEADELQELRRELEEMRDAL